MAQVAKEDGLDRDPTYVIRERRLKEELLVQMYGVKTADTVRVPDASSVKKYLADNPGKFSQRTRMSAPGATATVRTSGVVTGSSISSDPR